MFIVLGFLAQVCFIAVVASCIISCVSLPQSEVASVADESDATLPMTTSYCAKSIVSTSYTIAVNEPTVFAYDYDAMTVKQLMALCKERGIKRYSTLRKHELIALLSEF